VNHVIEHMLAGEMGLARHQPSGFNEACQLLEEVVKKEGNAEYEKANALCFVKHDDKTEVIDKFDVPFMDTILFSDRAKHSRMMIMDPDGKGMTIL
jgi:hypothetical protein